MKRRIVLLGPPASGKGTQAELIEARFGIPSASPGTLLREEKQAGTPLGVAAHELTSKGELLPDDLVVQLVASRVPEYSEGVVFDGFPRTVGQAEALDEILTGARCPLDVVILLEADPETIRERVRNRVVCSQCGRIFAVGLHVQSDNNVCPSCGGALRHRSDDAPQTLVHRLAQYREKTEPLIDYYTSRGLLVRINAARPSQLVFEDVAAALES